MLVTARWIVVGTGRGRRGSRTGPARTDPSTASKGTPVSATDVTAYLAALDGRLREAAEKLEPVIDAALPDGTGALWHGHPTWSLGAKPGQGPVCLLKAYASHLTFGLWRGQDVPDASGRLVPGARRMASVKLTSAEDVDPALFTGWLRHAVALETAALEAK